ncbi:GNAT superfamily N-acetyltransferase [Symbiobacterium terraclitae]|uniref:GNAT superfamily N-acetyltransferase n=1 Tax=Symbiobacterium terraclitae TaxID=557451 RepID=A0ABS4JWY3_9FIRM|nr:GNAT family N-acetyltransferase [Symbiobacterium terraclitae]MBP2020039.1 GNAT superfamily N-acetyltransferase [Symbiobacterium terraclitae]
MTLRIRPVRPDDYESLAACNRLAMPGTDDTAGSLRQFDGNTYAFARWVAEVDGRVVGSACWYQWPSRLHPQKFWMEGSVHPDFQRRGIGETLLTQVLDAVRQKGAISVRTYTREDYAGALRFLEKRGFAEAKRTWVSELDLARCNFAPFAGYAKRVEAAGIRLVQLPELQSTPDWQHRLRTLYNALQADVPDIDPAFPLTAEMFRENYMGRTSYMPEGHFIALEGDRWIGLSTLWKGTEPGQMNVGLTGVLPEYRRRGIALALKLRAMAWARGQGVTRLRTNNDSVNRPILALNERLGFVKEPAWVHLVRAF